MPQTIHKDSINHDENESQMVKDDDNNKLIVYASKDINTLSDQKDDQEIF